MKNFKNIALTAVAAVAMTGVNAGMPEMTTDRVVPATVAAAGVVGLLATEIAGKVWTEGARRRGVKRSTAVSAAVNAGRWASIAAIAGGTGYLTWNETGKAVSNSDVAAGASQELTQDAEISGGFDVSKAVTADLIGKEAADALKAPEGDAKVVITKALVDKINERRTAVVAKEQAELDAKQADLDALFVTKAAKGAKKLTVEQVKTAKDMKTAYDNLIKAQDAKGALKLEDNPSEDAKTKHENDVKDADKAITDAQKAVDAFTKGEGNDKKAILKGAIEARDEAKKGFDAAVAAFDQDVKTVFSGRGNAWYNTLLLNTVAIPAAPAAPAADAETPANNS